MPANNASLQNAKMTNPDVAGVVGAGGSLGSQLSEWIAKKHQVACFDIARNSVARSGNKRWVRSLGALTERSTIIHWCGTTEDAAEMTDLSSDQMLVLHDSVMTRSMDVAETLRGDSQFVGKVAIVHCLMNPNRTVAVANESNQPRRIKRHFLEIGCLPKSLSADEHDTIMAESQAPFALLHEILMPNLKNYARRGLLTPSGEALLNALLDRSAKWTPETLRVILSNPNLPQLIADMDVMIDGIQHSEHES